jgi:hypothetical protein
MNTKDKAFALDQIAAAAILATNDGVMPSGMVRWQYVDAGGMPIDGTGGFCNLVVDAGKAYIASRICGVAMNAISHVAIGSGTTAAAAGQTALVTETARVAISSATPVANVATYIATVPAGTGTGAVEEVGLFNAAAAGTMVARALTGSITKPAGLGLQFTWTITIS